jgi:hypothetical protein
VVADFVRAAVCDLDPEGPHRAREWLRTVTALAAWSQREGIPLDREEVFAPDNIRRYAEIGCPELSTPSTATRRAVLRTMGRALTEEAPWPTPEPMLPQRLRHQPYSAKDEQRLRALRLPTRHQQRRLDAVLALGLGAGLWAREYLTAGPPTCARSTASLTFRSTAPGPGTSSSGLTTRTRFAGSPQSTPRRTSLASGPASGTAPGRGTPSAPSTHPPICDWKPSAPQHVAGAPPGPRRAPDRARPERRPEDHARVHAAHALPHRAAGGDRQPALGGPGVTRRS